MWIQRFGQINTEYMLKMGLFCIYWKRYSAVHGAIVRSMIFFTHVCYIFSLFLRNIFLVNPVTAQYTISMKETMLKPRQSPNRPPREAMKSTGPILMLLSNSEKPSEMNTLFKFLKWFLTHDCLLAKKDIDNSDVLVPGVINFGLEKNISGRFYWGALEKIGTGRRGSGLELESLKV